MKALRLGTRGSQLALAQSRLVERLLLERLGIGCETIIIRTLADQRSETPLSELGTKRVFVKELEDALLNGTIDVAVHSSKDLPALLPQGLDLGGALPREDPRDAFVVAESRGALRWTLEDLVRALGQTPRIGTSSLRRSTQLRRVWPSASFDPIRGNLDTRLRKLDRGEYDVLVLAVAGLNRLGAAHRVSLAVPVAVSVPAPGQGTVALEIRSGDEHTRALISQIGDEPAMTMLTAERAVVVTLEAGCQAPLGALAEVDGGDLTLTVVVASLDGERLIRREDRGSRSRPADLGVRVGQAMLAEGARELLDQAERFDAPVEEQP